jgi:dipeptidyl aminopeptidase/acylaminoacyl peptidase
MADEGIFAWKKLRGDVLLTARVALPAQLPGEAGWMIRQTLHADSPFLSVVTAADGRTRVRYRSAPAGTIEEVKNEAAAHNVLQVERKGNTYVVSWALMGDPFATANALQLALGDEPYVGLCLRALSGKTTEVAFDNVRVVKPAPADLVPYRQYLASHLEILEVATGHRTLLYTDSTSIQAPNWTPDGKALIYNKNGLLYRFEMDGKKSVLINTGFANRNNNDHVLSFDGQWLGISHHSADDQGASMVYVLPSSGGNPIKVTQRGPSYLHGWSPDGKWLVYTGGRDGEYDIYRVAVTGGEEERLTTTPGLDDGPEYSPDGRFIYFNSVRSGLMQIWRMQPDGSGAEQLTNDAFNNWFPHLSPNGSSMVFISYGQDVAPSDHPFYKHVMLRWMPANGGKPRTLAYLYGGQGTINVPSWSPDGKYIAFVSNSR